MAVRKPAQGWDPWVLDRQHRWRDEMGVPDLDNGGASSEVSEANARAILHAVQERGLVFKGRRYRVPPVPFVPGLKLYQVRQRFQEATEADDTDALLQAYREGARIMKRLIQPSRWYQRVVWALLPNPFLKASEGEWKATVDFFLASRMRSGIRIPPGGPGRQASTT